MNTQSFARLSGAILALILGACSSQASLSVTPGTSDVGMSQPHSPRVLPGSTAGQGATSYVVLSRFPGASKGVQPLSSLVSIGSGIGPVMRPLIYVAVG
jgi:hypothetical protein